MDQTNYAKELEDESMSDEQWNELAEKAWKAKDFLQNFDTPSERQRQLIQELHHRRGANRTRTLGRDFTFLSEERVSESILYHCPGTTRLMIVQKKSSMKLFGVLVRDA